MHPSLAALRTGPSDGCREKSPPLLAARHSAISRMRASVDAAFLRGSFTRWAPGCIDRGLVTELAQLSRTAYQAQQIALRLSMAAAHAGLRLVMGRKRIPSAADLLALRRRLEELHARDLEHVERGDYPRELLFQLPLREYASHVPKLSAEVLRMLQRAKRGKVRDFPPQIDLSRYPEYFRRNFHWQSDGYLSRRSAELYDFGVEFLFLGTGDVMRRQVIPPISQFLRESPGEKRILDVACGTGRMLHQLSRAHPDHRYSGVDLSPFYVDRARELLSGLGVSLLVDNAETLPLKEASFDVALSVFLFHELPRRARKNVLREMRRVVDPSGLVVIEDAAQLNDSPELRVFLENFSLEMNEPFFSGYLAEPLETDLEEAGFRVESVEPAFLSKVVVARPV
jgi:ubiquinone/menaquinone biosynthesis C-methylase UbiE